MELNEKFKSYENKLNDPLTSAGKDTFLREFHIAIENIFDDLKSSKSSRDYKWLFLLLLSLCIIATTLHIAKFGVGLNLIAILLLIIYWVYYRYKLKEAIIEQSVENKKIKEVSSSSEKNADILLNRLQYIFNGVTVLETRIELVRNQYVAFFPVFTMLMIDFIKGPMTIAAFITTAVIAIILGGLFWIYYFKNDLDDLDNSVEELEMIREKLKDLK